MTARAGPAHVRTSADGRRAGHRLLGADFTASGAFVALPVATAHAAQPTSTNCWGVVTSQRASTAHAIGEHVASQDAPHAGLTNVAHALGFDGPGELGSFLVTVDGDPDTRCAR
jgi:hypothetical protein